MKNLVIVESPAKSKTIEKYLGKDYKVVSSVGHIRDLATRGKEGLGVDVEHNFEPTYVISKEKKDVVTSLKKDVAKAQTVYLATDPDREGEAISWHLKEALNIKDDEVESYLNNLQDILNFADVVNKAPIEGLEGTIGANENYNVFRKDEIKVFDNHEALLQNAPEQER